MLGAHFFIEWLFFGSSPKKGQIEAVIKNHLPPSWSLKSLNKVVSNEIHKNVYETGLTQKPW